MARWQLSVQLDEGQDPVFLRIARALIDAIRRGRLGPGQRLPGSRELARQLGVHRNTVLAALAELVAQGWLRSEPARGTFVSDDLPDDPPRSAPREAPWGSAHGFALPPLPPLSTLDRSFDPPPRGVLHLSAGSPDPRLFPVDALGRAWRRVLRRAGGPLLGYGSPAGHPALRRALAEMIGALRAVAARPEHVLVTRGSQMALDLCSRGLLAPGDLVAVEALGYRPAWDALRLAGAQLAPVPVDAQGLDVEALARLARRRPLRAVYLTPHHQYPTTVTLAPGRRMELLALARRERLLIIEDDYDHEFHYEGRPVLPLAAADGGAHVVYLGTLSKVLAPGLRLGFLVAAAPVVARLAALRAAMDRQGDHTLEAAVAEWIDEGELQRHIRKMRRAYRERRDALAEALGKKLAGALSFDLPQGGISLWARVAPDLDSAAWVEAAAARGVVLFPGHQYTFDRSDPSALRLVFSMLSPAELTRAVGVLDGCRPRPRARAVSW